VSYTVEEDRESFKDRADQEVRRGDRIAYAVRVFNDAQLVLGTVLNIQRVKPEYGWERWRITVQGDTRTKPSRLEYPSRIVKLG
jgi:hypothetical protein